MIFFLQSLGLALAHNMLCDYLQSGVVTTLNSTTGNIINAEFPALHICNSYQIRSKKLLFLLPLQPMHSLLPFGQHCQHDSPKFSKINLPLCCENKFMHFHLKRLWNSVQCFFRKLEILHKDRFPGHEVLDKSKLHVEVTTRDCNIQFAKAPIPISL